MHRPARRRLGLLGLAAASAVVLAGCSGTPAPGASASPGSSSPPTTSGPASGASPSPSPSLATLPAARCLTGDWRLVRFVGAEGQTYGTGQGGDVTVRFAGDAYTLRGAGKTPITVTLAGGSADLTVDGRAEGTFTLADATATFRQRSSAGSATLAAGGRSRRLTMGEVTSVVGLKGEGQVACTAEAMTITLAAVRLELGRA